MKGGIMSAKNGMVCDYCGRKQEKVMFCIGASRGPEWTMHEGTGKVSCDSEACWNRATLDGQNAVKQYVESINRKAGK